MTKSETPPGTGGVSVRKRSLFETAYRKALVREHSRWQQIRLWVARVFFKDACGFAPGEAPVLYPVECLPCEASCSCCGRAGSRIPSPTLVDEFRLAECDAAA